MLTKSSRSSLRRCEIAWGRTPWQRVAHSRTKVQPPRGGQRSRAKVRTDPPRLLPFPLLARVPSIAKPDRNARRTPAKLGARLTAPLPASSSSASSSSASFSSSSNFPSISAYPFLYFFLLSTFFLIFPWNASILERSVEKICFSVFISFIPILLPVMQPWEISRQSWRHSLQSCRKASIHPLPCSFLRYAQPHCFVRREFWWFKWIIHLRPPKSRVAAELLMKSTNGRLEM